MSNKNYNKELNREMEFRSKVINNIFAELEQRCVVPMSSIDAVLEVGGFKGAYMSLVEGVQRIRHLMMGNSAPLHEIVPEIMRLVENCINLLYYMKIRQKFDVKDHRSLRERFMDWLSGRDPNEELEEEEPYPVMEEAPLENFREIGEEDDA
jgi:hypothetical protein